jgi:hypothetical protein
MPMTIMIAPATRAQAAIIQSAAFGEGLRDSDNPKRADRQETEQHMD